MFRIAAAAMALMLVATGCARYEHDLVMPPELARHIGSDADSIFRDPPLEYRLRSVEGRLVMRVFNPTPDPVTLLGEKSYVVDPGGQSHPLRGQTIAPDTFVRLILPPMRPGYYESNPSIGIGLGVGFSRAHFHRFGPPFYDPAFDEPRYYTFYDEADTTYWNWEGQTSVRVHLVYQRGQETVTHDFTFRRKKM